jgi:hypothetical protein
MELAQVLEMKNKIVEELRQIEGLRQAMEQTFAGLVEWEKQLQGGAAASKKSAARRSVATAEVPPKPENASRAADATPGDRVNKALVAIRGEFTRSQLLAQAEGDGKGEIISAVYSSIFAKLLKKQRIECVQGSPRQRDSLYMRAGEKRFE